MGVVKVAHHHFLQQHIHPLLFVIGLELVVMVVLELVVPA
jgi:hypothetical protein